MKQAWLPDHDNKAIRHPGNTVDGGDRSVFTEQPPDQRDQGLGESLPP
jgi:hypothetical protein